MENNTIIVDSDALIALFIKEDKNNIKSTHLFDIIRNSNLKPIFPTTVLAETLTTLQRKLNKKDVAHKLTRNIKEDYFVIESVDSDIIQEAIILFDPLASKKHTIFDAIVAAIAKRKNAKAIFSFDKWYQKSGYKLLTELF